IEKIKQFKFDIEDTYIFLGLIWKTISGKESIDLSEALGEIYDNPSKRVCYLRKFLSEDNILVQNDLIEIIEPRFFRDNEMKLTKRSQNFLDECGIKLFLYNKKKDAIICPFDIGYRELIFDPSEMNQIFLLTDLLQED